MTVKSGDLQPAGDGESRGSVQPDAPGRRAIPAPLAEDSRIAVEIRGLIEHGALDDARERFSELVTMHQRRASRIAYQYLRDAAEADEAVQDAFVKVFSHLTSYREAWPFEVWFTRILINGCLDRRKARIRRGRWFGSEESGGPAGDVRAATLASSDVGPEARLLARERRARMAAPISRLEGRQRTVFMLCH